MCFEFHDINGLNSIQILKDFIDF